MILKHSQYRDFELSRLVYMAEGPEAEPTSEPAPDTKPEETEETVEPTSETDEVDEQQKETPLTDQQLNDKATQLTDHITQLERTLKEGNLKPEEKEEIEAQKNVLENLREGYSKAVKKAQGEQTDTVQNYIKSIDSLIEAFSKKSDSTPEEAPEESEQLPENVQKAKEAILKSKDFEALAGINVEEITNQSGFDEFLTEWVQNLDKDRIDQLAKGKPLSRDEKESMITAFKKQGGLEDLESKNDDEVKLVSDIDGFSKKFGKSGEQVAELVSRLYKVEQTEEGLKIDGEVVENVDDLTTKLPDNIQKLLDVKKGEDPDLKALANAAGLQNKTMEGLTQALEGLAGSEEVEKKGGWLSMLISLFSMLKEFENAMKTGDFSLLQDSINDIMNGKMPPKERAKAHEGYQQDIVEYFGSENVNLNTVLDAYFEPRGSAADTIFESSDKYREGVDGMIIEQMNADIASPNITVSSIEPLAGRGRQVTFYREGVPYTLDLYGTEGGMKGTLTHVETVTEGEDDEAGQVEKEFTEEKQITSYADFVEAITGETAAKAEEEAESETS